MPKIKTYTAKALVKLGQDNKAYAEVDQDSLVENPEVPPFRFDEKDIAKYAQEVAEFNNVEKSAIESMGVEKDPYTIEFKLIVQ